MTEKSDLTKEQLWNDRLFRLFIKGLDDKIEAEYLIGALECMKSAYLCRAYIDERRKFNNGKK